MYFKENNYKIKNYVFIGKWKLTYYTSNLFGIYLQPIMILQSHHYLLIGCATENRNLCNDSTSTGVLSDIE